MSWRRALAAATLWLALPVQAADAIKVGRASIGLPEGVWTNLARGETTAAVVENRGVLKADIVALGLSEGGRLKAVVIVMASAGGVGRSVEWQTSCSGSNSDLWSAVPPGGNFDDNECVNASVPFVAPQELDERLPLANALRRMNFELPESLVLASAFIGTQLGAVMSIEVYAADDFAGLPAPEIPAALPSGVDPAHAAFALALALRVRASAYSWRGTMELPPVRFRQAVPADRPVALFTY